MKQTLMFFVMLVSTMFILTACGADLGDPKVYMGGEVKEKEDKIVIAGESNLLPGSRVHGVLYVDDGEEVFADVTELVDDKGRFKMEMDHHQYGDAEVVVTFGFADQVQEEEIVEHYGEGGNELKGPYVLQDEQWGEPQKKAVVRLDLPADSEEDTYAFSEPDWNEKPDDYGDPRVRIEVEEITEDDEYFYVKGKSNLLEGSKISGYYSDRWGVTDETRVNPDGTFDLKIEYKYSEDPYFTIIFKPSSQWESIKENYGSNGEKLVGSLVETSNDNLHVEAIIDYEHE
ncbi:hypothetical protein ACLIBG_10830 [Virgibacillus sp. W0181]|uniref:hypothetical protein n=1 Tax=Virgibacillus sp. W0181 TaxID=3391581 RepID=UPI003F46B1C5